MVVGLPQEQKSIGKGADSEAGTQGLRAYLHLYVTSDGKGGKGESRSFIPVTGTSVPVYVAVSINSCLRDPM